MTSVFQARRRAEEFAAAVDAGAESSAAYTEELSDLLTLVASLRDQQPVAPRADFAVDLRSRLMQEAEVVLKPETAGLRLPVRERGRRERRLVAAASAFVLIGGTTTMAAAAQGALPGDALYPIKRSIESAQAELSTSSAGKGRDLLNQASDRLTEVQALVGEDSLDAAPRVPETLQSFSSSASEGSALLFKSFRDSADPQDVVAVRTFASEGIARLKELAPRVPNDAQDELASAAILLHDLDTEASSLCSTCAADLPAVEVPGIFLARADVDRALSLAASHELENNHPVVVRKDAVRSLRDAAQTSGPSAGGPTGAPQAPQAPAAPPALPSPTWDPNSWPTLLPGTDGGTTSKSSSGDTSTTDPLSGSLKDGLSGVVETLLPDAGGN